MDRTTSLLATLLLCIVALTAVLVMAPANESAASTGPQAPGETLQPQTEDALAIPVIAAPLVSTSSFTVALPLILNSYFPRLPCPADSPFGIEIAAIHQIVPDGTEASPERALAEAQWLARVEAGFATLVDALESSGTCWTRVELNWRQIEPDPAGPYNFTFFDQRLQLLAEAGIQVSALVHSVPGWAGPHPRGPIDPERLNDFVQFLADLVARYKEPPYNIHHWEIFNEPDARVPRDPDPPVGWGGYGDQYAHMLEVAYTAIKAIDPGATVLMGGIAYDGFDEYEDGSWFYRYFPDDVMEAGGGYWMDATNFHYFPDFALEWERWNSGAQPRCGDIYAGPGPSYEAGGIDIIAKTNHFRNRLRVCHGVDKPVWLTELGEHGYNGDPLSLAQQARYVVQGQVRALATGVERIIWYALVSPPTDPYGQGLLYKSDWSPKPAYYTYRILIQEMTGYAPAYSLNVPGVEGYVFRDAAGLEKTVAWAWGEAGQPAFLTFTSASQLRVVDRQGGVTFVEDGGPGDEDGVANGSVRLSLPPPPVNPDPNSSLRFSAEPFFISK